MVLQPVRNLLGRRLVRQKASEDLPRTLDEELVISTILWEQGLSKCERLGAMLRAVLSDPDGATPLPGLERRLIGAASALVSTRAAAGDPQRLRDLEPELSELLLASL